MQLIFNHHINKDILMERLKKVFNELKEEHSDVQILEEQWLDYGGNFAAKANGVKIKGSLEVRDNEIVINASIPFMLKPFEGQIREVFEKEFFKRILY